MPYVSTKDDDDAGDNDCADADGKSFSMDHFCNLKKKKTRPTECGISCLMSRFVAKLFRPWQRDAIMIMQFCLLSAIESLDFNSFVRLTFLLNQIELLPPLAEQRAGVVLATMLLHATISELPSDN